LPVMGLLANNHLGERGLFAYLSSRHGLLKNYVPFDEWHLVPAKAFDHLEFG
jgi:hypothetical protein